MEKILTAAYDEKALMYTAPMAEVSVAAAIRNFSDAASDPNSQLSKHPEDFTLMQIATYDDTTGVITPMIPPTTLARAIEFAQKQLPFEMKTQDDDNG